MANENATADPVDDLVIPDQTVTEEANQSEETKTPETEGDKSVGTDEKPEETKDDSESPVVDEPPVKEGEETQKDDQEPLEQPDQKEQARQDYEQRQISKQQREQQITSEYAPYVNDEEATAVERLEMQMRLKDYANTVATNETALTFEAERLHADPELTMFNPKSKDYNAELRNYVLSTFDATSVEYDEVGHIVGVKGSLYDHFKQAATLFKGAAQSGQRQAQQAEANMRSKVTTPSATNQEKQVDPLHALWD